MTYEENAVTGKWKEPQSLHGCGTGLPCHLRPLTHLRFLGKEKVNCYFIELAKVGGFFMTTA